MPFLPPNQQRQRILCKIFAHNSTNPTNIYSKIRNPKERLMSLAITAACQKANCKCLCLYCEKPCMWICHCQNHQTSGLEITCWLPTHTHTHTRLTALFPGLPKWASTRKVKPIWILLEQETVSGSGISWAICKSAPCSRQIPCQHPTTQFFCRPDALPAAQPTVSKHWRQNQSTEGIDCQQCSLLSVG